MDFEIISIIDSPYEKSFSGELGVKFKVNPKDENFEKPLSDLEKEY